MSRVAWIEIMRTKMLVKSKFYLVQILVAVANIQLTILKADVEKVFM